MKKIFSLVYLLAIFSLWCTTMWAGTWTKTISAQIDSQVFNQASAEVQNIEVKFCGSDAKTKKYNIIAGEEKDICLEIINSADKDVLISMDFVDGTFTNDQWKNRACMDNNAKEKFGQYITGIENSFVVPAKSSIIKHAKLDYPKNTKGNILGCLVYYTKGVSMWWDLDFNILIRRAKFIDVSITKPFRSTYKRKVGIIIIIILLASSFFIGRKTPPRKRYKK